MWERYLEGMPSRKNHMDDDDPEEMYSRECRRNIQGSTACYRLMQALRLSIRQSQALQNLCMLQSA